MNLKFKVFDGRSDNDIDVINEATNEIVGYIKTRPRSGIRISLFDQKYQGVVSSYEECFGFISGVQSVLNRLVSVNDGRQGTRKQIVSG